MSHRLVLIVEDSREVAANLEIACTAMENVEVKVAMGAEQAWQALAQVRPGEPLVIVTDIRLPDTDGFELMRRVRQDDRFLRTPIVAVSGEEDAVLRQRLDTFHVSAFYRKPYSISALRRHLETLLA